MTKTGLSLILTFTISAVVMFSYPVYAEPVKCEQCTEEYPCAALFEFKNVRFTHKVFCRVDEEGRERWDSNDYEKFDVFYFEGIPKRKTRDEVRI